MALKIRKIETKENVEKKEHRNKVIIGVILAVLMLFSTAGYALFSGERTSSDSGNAGKVNYNGLDFLYNGDYWGTSISGYNFYFTYLPNETKKVNVNRKLNEYSGKPLYFTENTVAEGEIVRNIGSFVSRTQQACLEETNCTGDFPIKDCSSNIIVIEEANFSASMQEGNCTYLFTNDSIRDADAFLYRILGIN